MARESTWSFGRSLRLQAVVNLVASHWNHGIVFLQLALNAVVGYGFTRMLANMYGVSAAKDGFDIAYSVPFIILNLSGFAFGHAVISTHFAKLRVTDPEKLQVVFSTILHLMLLVGALLVGACYVWDEQLIQLLAPGLPAAARDQARQSMLLMLPLTFTLGLSAYWSAVLVAFKVPFTAEACQLISRLGVLVWFLASGPAFGFVGISLGLVGASVSGLAIEWFVLRKYTGLSLTLDFSPRDPKVREVVWQGSSFLFATLVAQASMSYMRRAGTLDGIGTNSMMTYCFSLITPISILIGKPLALVMGPSYVTLAASQRFQEARQVLLRNMAVSVGIGIIAAPLISGFASPLVSLFYRGGSFDDRAIEMTAEMCVLFAWSLPPMIVLWVVLMPILNGKSRLLPATIYAVGYFVHIGATAMLFPGYGKEGLVIAYLLCVYLQAGVSTAVVFQECLRLRLPSTIEERTCRESTY